jgi:hypothetical protein
MKKNLALKEWCRSRSTAPGRVPTTNPNPWGLDFETGRRAHLPGGRAVTQLIDVDKFCNRAIPSPIPKIRGYHPGDRAAPYAGPDPVVASQRLAEAEAASRRAEEHPETDPVTEPRNVAQSCNNAEETTTS